MRQFHPLCEMFPLLDGKEFEDLVEDARARMKDGLPPFIEPIVLLEGMVLDGRSRERVGERIGVPPPASQWNGKGSPIAFVISKNVFRRHLNASQRAWYAAEAVPLLKAEAEARKKATQFSTAVTVTPPARSPVAQGESAQIAARAAGVSKSSVEAAGKVRKKGSPELQQAVAGGKVKVKTAARVTDLPPEKQLAAAEREAKRARRAEEKDTLQDALGAGGKHLEAARRSLEKAAKAIHGYDAAPTIKAIEKAQSCLADDTVKLLERFRQSR